MSAATADGPSSCTCMMPMRDATPSSSAPRELESANRRQSEDRRSEPNEGRRGPASRPRSRMYNTIARDLVIGVSAVVAIVFTVNRVHPIFANQPTVVASLTKAIPGAKAVLNQPAAIADTGVVAQYVKSPKFEADRTAFSADLVRTGRMSQARADSIAYYAVREAYANAIPPAVVF